MKHTSRVAYSIPPGYSNNPKDFVPEDFLDPEWEPGLWHATTNLPVVLREGLKSRLELKRKGLGGGIEEEDPDLVSVTYNEARAVEIADMLRLVGKIVKNKISASDILSEIESRFMLEITDPSGFEALEKSLPVELPPNITIDNAEEVYGWLDKTITTPEEKYEFLQELDDNFSAVGEPTEFIRVGLTADFEDVKYIDPDKVGIVEVAIRKNARIVHIPDEDEIRVRPEDVVVIAGNELKEIEEKPLLP